jgi:acetate kinase
LALESVSDPQAREQNAATGNGVVLALNSGSSSLKFGLYRVSSSETALLISGIAESTGGDSGDFLAHDSRSHRDVHEPVSLRGPNDVLARIVRLLDEWGAPAPTCVGHRIVHGGPTLRAHCLIDEAVLVTLQAAVAFAPLHMPSALAVIRFAREHFRDVPHVACFDTAFHATMLSVARTLPLPESLRSAGIERYGFHGLSCESIVRQLGRDLPHRLIIAHLGNGSSITAVRDGHSIDTSMGLTPTGGVIMGTRSGDLDPGLLVYLMREKSFDVDQIENLVNHHSGLLALSGTTSDMRGLRSMADTDAPAALAIQMYGYSVAKQIAAMMTALKGADLLVFAGGIGENDERTRTLICSYLEWTGIALDETRNAGARNSINAETSNVAVRVISSEEDAQIAIHSDALVRSHSPQATQLT